MALATLSPGPYLQRRQSVNNLHSTWQLSNVHRSSKTLCYSLFTIVSQGTVSKATLESSLRECLPLWDGAVIEELLSLTDEAKSETGDSILYKNLFVEDDTGTMGAFVNKLLDQEKMERIKYIKEIEIHLEDKG